MVYVRAYSRMVDGDAVHVSSHERSAPRTSGGGSESKTGGKGGAGAGQAAEARRADRRTVNERLSDVPDIKKDLIRPQVEKWEEFKAAVDDLPQAAPTERWIYRQLFALEGGIRIDNRESDETDKGAVGGITTSTLSAARTKWGIEGLTADTFPKDLTASQRARIMRAYFDDNWRRAGGRKAMEEIDHDGVALFAADTTYRYGTVGIDMVQKSVNAARTAQGKPQIRNDSMFGTGTLDALKDAISTREGRLIFAEKLKEIRDRRSPKEIWRTDYLLSLVR